MSKLIWIALAVVVVGYLVTTSIAEKAEKESIRIEAEKQENATKLAVAKMSKQVNAITDWDKKLSNGESYRFEPILTVELERLWLQQNPILFIGSINDIATHDESHYLLSVERSFSSRLSDLTIKIL